MTPSTYFGFEISSFRPVRGEGILDSSVSIYGAAAARFALARASARRNERSPKFRVVAFYTGRNDKAHISFVARGQPLVPANGC